MQQDSTLLDGAPVFDLTDLKSDDPEARDRISRRLAVPFSDLRVRPQPFTVPEMIPGGIVFFSGPPGGFKSWIVYDLVRAVLTGTPWLASSIPARKGPALIFNYDQPGAECKRRLVKFGIGSNREGYLHTAEVLDKGAEILRIHMERDPKTKKPVDMNRHVEVMRLLVESLQPRLIVIDSLRQAWIGNDSDSDACGILMNEIKTIVGDPERRTIVVIHHTKKDPVPPGKSGGKKVASWQDSRGSGELIASADTAIDVQHDADSGTGLLTWVKARSWVVKPNAVAYKVVEPEGEDGPISIEATSAVPGIDQNEAGIRMVSETIDREGDRLGLSEIRGSTRMRSPALRNAINAGVERGMWHLEGAGRKSRKQFVKLGPRADCKRCRGTPEPGPTDLGD